MRGRDERVPIRRHGELHDHLTRIAARHLDDADVFALGIVNRDLIRAEARDVRVRTIGRHRKTMRPRHQHFDLFRRHGFAVDHCDPRRSVDGRHRARGIQLVALGVEREQARSDRLGLRDDVIGTIELHHGVVADERDVPVRSVRLDDDMVWLGMRREAERREVDDSDDRVRCCVDDGDFA